MHQGQYEEAEGYLQEALTKAPADADSLANLVVVSQHLQRAPEVIGRYLSQLKAKQPDHTLLAALHTFESAFDRVSATLKA
jgi:coatomer subunit epsilon